MGRLSDYVFSGDADAREDGDVIAVGQGKKKLRRRKKAADMDGGNVTKIEVYCLECESRDSIVNGCCQICGHENAGRQVDLIEGGRSKSPRGGDDASGHQRHRYATQVGLDAARAMTQFQLEKGERQHYIGEVEAVIHDVLCANPCLHYYQGFHDVCSVLVLVMGRRSLASPLAIRLASGYLREAMDESIKGAMQALSLILQILKRIDNKLWRVMAKEGMEPQFALSWVLTWFAHDLRSLSQVQISPPR